MAKIKFEELVLEFKKLYDSCDMKIEFHINGLGFLVPNKKLNELILGEELKPEEVKKELDYKIHLFNRAITSILKDEEFEVEIKKEFVNEEKEEILKIVRENFIDEDLKNKFIFEVSAKDRILKDFEWEISAKEYDRTLKEKVSGVKTCLLKLSLQDQKKTSSGVDGVRSTTVELRKKDVEGLIESLEKARDLL